MEEYKFLTTEELRRNGYNWGIAWDDSEGFYRVADYSLIFFDLYANKHGISVEKYYGSLEEDDLGLGMPYNGYLYWMYNEPLDLLTYDFPLYALDDEEMYKEVFERIEEEVLHEDFVLNKTIVIHESEGTISAYEYYLDGESIGDKVRFYNNGNLESIICYSIGCGSISGRVFEWYENGALSFEGYRKYDRDLLYKKYDENGKLIDYKTELTKEEKEEGFIKYKYKKNYIKEAIKAKKHAVDLIQNIISNSKTPTLSEWEKNNIKLIQRCYSKSFYEKVEEARKNGAYCDYEIPDTLPENMNPPNPIRKPLKSPQYAAIYEIYLAVLKKHNIT